MSFSVVPKNTLRAIQIKTMLVILVLLGASLVFWCEKTSYGIAVGGLLSLLNLSLLARILENIFSQEKPNKALVVWQYSVKLLVLYGIIYFLITYDIVNPIGFIAGFSLFLLGIILESLFPTKNPNPRQNNLSLSREKPLQFVTKQ